MNTINEQIAVYKGLTADKVLQMASELLKIELQKGPAITSTSAAVQYLQATLKNKDREYFHVIFLDTKHKVITGETLFQGTIDGACVYPRVIASEALKHNASAIVIAHNHPSGNSEPSLADQTITRRIKDALQLLEIRLLDHFVIGDGEPTSMASRGML